MPISSARKELEELLKELNRSLRGAKGAADLKDILKSCRERASRVADELAGSDKAIIEDRLGEVRRLLDDCVPIARRTNAATATKLLSALRETHSDLRDVRRAFADGNGNPLRLSDFASKQIIAEAKLTDGIAPSLSEKQRTKARDVLTATIDEVQGVLDSVGPLRNPKFVFDPAGFDVISHIVAEALTAQERVALATPPDHFGSGVYALFYSGDLSFYSPLKDMDTPIYVGSAGPRTHDAALPDAQGNSLAQRLKEHRDNIRRIEDSPRGNLRVDDFEYRALVVRSGWEKAAEDYLIRYYQPVWNTKVKGLGKHGDKGETRSNSRSYWDQVHPGRSWAWASDAPKCDKTESEIIKIIREHLKENPPRKLDIATLVER